MGMERSARVDSRMRMISMMARGRMMNAHPSSAQERGLHARDTAVTHPPRNARGILDRRLEHVSSLA